MSVLIGAVSEFSLGESLLSPEEIAQIAVDNGYSAVTLTDRNLSSMMRFTKACDKVNVKPIIGASVSVYDDAFDKTPKKKRETPNLYFQLRLFARTEAGMQGIYRLLTLAASEERFYYYPRLALIDLLDELGNGGLAVSSGSFWSVFSHPHWASKWRAIVKAAQGQAYRELVAVNTPYFQRVNQIAIETNQNDPYIVSRPVLYADKDYARTLDVLRTITAQQKMSQPFRSIQWARDLAPCDQETLVREHVAKVQGFLAERSGASPSVWRDALMGNEALAESCQYHWHAQEISLPIMADDEEAEMVRLIKEGWEERLGGPQLGFQPFDLEPYKQRLGHELKILKEMGFIRYFLLVRDVIAWAKENNIRVGPARGSVAGSLVAYLIHITDIDPLRFDLLFERFINPDRLELPDIDMDFATSGRERVLHYLVERHGEESVSAITNFSTLASASALREVCRIHELPAAEYECTKLVPKDAGLSYELNEAADVVPELATFRRDHGELWTHAVRLQGRMRAYGVHAAGVCVGGEPIVNRGALTHKKGGLPTVGYDKREVEDQGLIKIDVLGLSTLDIHKIALDLIQERHSRELLLIDIPLDDVKTLEAFGQGDTEAVFQMEGAGARRLLVEMGEAAALTFEDIVAVNALNRPGPLQSGMAEEYVAVRRGERYQRRWHPKVDAVLEKTLGTILYQESIMRLCTDVCGFTMPEADGFRKIIGKKLRDKILEQREKFVEGAVNNGVDRMVADQLFDAIEKFAAYGFNRSHSVGYSVISYWSMWLRVHYPAEFFAAAMTVLDSDKVPDLVHAAEQMGIKVMPPDINRSKRHFVVAEEAGEVELIAPLDATKGVAGSAVDAILEVREEGPFEHIGDFLQRVNKSRCNKRVQSVLDKVGAFARLGETPKELRAALELKYPWVSFDQSQVTSETRKGDQLELLPGLVRVSFVSRVISRDADINRALNEKVMRPIFGQADENSPDQWLTEPCQRCSYAGAPHVPPRFGRAAKAVVVTDCPTYGEEDKGKIVEGLGSEYVREALETAGLSVSDFYWTTLVKSRKPKRGRLKPDEIGACSPYLDQELSVLRPGLIVALGSNVTKHLIKGSKFTQDDAGKVVFVQSLNAAVVVGLNPQSAFVNPDSQSALNDTFEKAAELLK